MKLVVGLGNPGRQYTQTRHNIGFRVVEQIASTNGGGTWAARFEGLVCDVRIGGEKALLLKPMTYMNRSGRSVREGLDFYKIEVSGVLVICDDVNLDLGKLRLRSGGSAGGNNGLKDIILHLGTEEFPRLRVGVGGARPGEMVDHVLGEFRGSDKDLAENCVIEAGRAAERWCQEGLAVAMNEFNGIDLSKE
jgi:peptidyl-tRNA hydrolase, PTH1 family